MHAHLVLVHGSLTNGALTWGAQRELADRWELVVVHDSVDAAATPAIMVSIRDTCIGGTSLWAILG